MSWKEQVFCILSAYLSNKAPGVWYMANIPQLRAVLMNDAKWSAWIQPLAVVYWPYTTSPRSLLLKNARPVALMSVAMKCFERLVMAHINTIIPETLDPLQFAYRSNRSTDDDISIALHTALSHLDKGNTYVRMLFIDYSSAFNTIVPSKVIPKQRTL